MIAVILAGALAGCGGQSGGSRAALRAMSAGTPTTAGTTSSACPALTAAVVSKVTSTEVSSAKRVPLVFSMPGLHPVRADACDFAIADGGALRMVEVRWSTDRAAAIFAVLAKYDTAGLTHHPAGARALRGDDVYWQSVGDTLWVHHGRVALTVQFVTDAESDSYLRAAVALAQRALTALA